MTKIVTSKWTDYIDWASEVEEPTAFDLFTKISNKTIELAKNGKKEKSLDELRYLKNLMTAYASHLSNNINFYQGNNEAVNYLQSRKQKIFQILENLELELRIILL